MDPNVIDYLMTQSLNGLAVFDFDLNMIHINNHLKDCHNI
jgi:hypothetical protein